MTAGHDFYLLNCGTFFLLSPVSDRANEWVAIHVPAGAQRSGATIIIEPRYFPRIADGIADAGLTIHGTEAP